MKEQCGKKALLFLELCLAAAFLLPCFLSGILLLFFPPIGWWVLAAVFVCYAFFAFYWIPHRCSLEFALITSDLLQIRRGIFIQKNILIPRVYIRWCSFSCFFLQRPFGLVTLRWVTLSGEVSFSNLTWEQAMRLTEKLSLPVPHTVLQRMASA